jgi:hypothetical protein
MCEGFPSIKQKGVTLILLRSGEEPVFATVVSGKREILRRYQKARGDVLLAVWTGQWSSDVFEVDEKTWVDWLAEC